MKNYHYAPTKIIINSDYPGQEDKLPRWTVWIVADGFYHNFQNVFVQQNLDHNNPMWTNGHMIHQKDCECVCCQCKEKHCECDEYGS
jgi:hypothetical protein